MKLLFILFCIVDNLSSTQNKSLLDFFNVMFILGHIWIVLVFTVTRSVLVNPKTKQNIFFFSVKKEDKQAGRGLLDLCCSLTQRK